VIAFAAIIAAYERNDLGFIDALVQLVRTLLVEAPATYLCVLEILLARLHAQIARCEECIQTCIPSSATGLRALVIDVAAEVLIGPIDFLTGCLQIQFHERTTSRR
jgi:hypothetical protein